MIGISEISIYLYNVSNNVIENLNQNYSKKFIKLIDYQTKYKDVCKHQSNDKIKIINNLYTDKTINNELVFSKTNYSLIYKIDSLEYISNLKRKIDLASCLNAKLKKYTNFQKNWNSYFASLMNMRSGKSIFSTDYTERINQHYTDISKFNKHFCYKVPVNDAFCGYFWENFDFLISDLKNQTFSI